MPTTDASRRAALARLAQLGLGLVAVSCAPAPAPSALAKGATPTVAPARPEFNPVLANSELVKGKNRFAMGLIGDDGRPITDASVRFGFFQIVGPQATKRSEAEARFRWVDVQTKGIYVAAAEFDVPGPWGVEMAAVRPDGRAGAARVPFEVREKGSAPMIGSPAPRSRSATVRDVRDPAELCTAAPPCELHALSVDEALASGKPSLVYFATPGYCTSGTCAPSLGSVLQARAGQAERVNFIHVEIYKDPRNQVVADAVTEWNLPSEPWVFLVDRGGLIADRFEGIVTAEELTTAVQNLA